MTPEAEAGWRLRARSDLLDFTRWMFLKKRNQKWQMGAQHYKLDAALMRVYAGQCKRLIINIPPRYSKTEFAVNFMGWGLGHYPDSEFIYTSYSATLAENASYACRELVQHPEYQSIFPNTKISGDSTARAHWRTTSGGVVYAVGSGGTITGYGAGKMRPGFGGAIIIDDPHKADEGDSDKIRKGVLEWFQNTLESRCNNPETPIIVIMQRLHMEDLAGWLLANGNGEKWESVVIPAINADGTALWPRAHTIEKLREMETSKPYIFSGQYLQTPTPREGGMFKPDRIEVVDVAPSGLKLCRGWDQAATMGGGDHTVGALLGRASDGVWWILDIARQQTAEPRAMLKQVAGMDGKAVPISWPQDPGAAGKDQARSLTSDLAGHIFHTSPETGAKEIRWEPFAAQVNGGNVKMVRAPWNRGLLEEMQTAPRGAHDDQLDALARAFGYLTGGNTGILDYYASLR